MTPPGLYIDGQWRSTPAARTAVLRDSTTEEVFAEYPLGGARDVDLAVDAAERAFRDWSVTTPKERRDLMVDLCDALGGRLEHLTTDISRQVGMPLPTAAFFQTGAAHAILSSYVDLLDSYVFEEQVGHSLVVREPAGVVGAITPWNFPLVQLAFKVAPALAAGCTVVLKPSEVAPLAALAFAELVHEVGFPPGVFNVVTGEADVGTALVAHPGVDAISFTGSTITGRQVAASAAATVKRTVLELGGKSASVVLEDADLPAAVTASVLNAFLNSGQTCFSWTRLLVHRSQLAEAGMIATAVAESLVLGNPLVDGTQLGPVVSAAQRERVRNHIEQAISEGARLLTGGSRAPVGLEQGYFVRPTVFSDVTRSMRIAREEVFGPVLSILAFDDVDDAVDLANDTDYGLHGGVWSTDVDRALKVARRLRTGAVDINGAPLNIAAPFGGYKQSGLGREWGVYGLGEYLEHKAIQLPTTGEN